MPSATLTLTDSPALRDACSSLVRQLRSLGYPHADHSTCQRMLRAYFPYEPELVDGTEDAIAAEGFLTRFLDECKRRYAETGGLVRARRCYGQAVEQAMTEVEFTREVRGRAPRLTELMTQLDADGHDTTHLRRELEGLIDQLGMHQFYR